MAEIENNTAQGQQEAAVVMIALTKKRGGKKVLSPSMEGYESGYNIDGIYVKAGGESRIFAINDFVLDYGIGSEDLPSTDPLYGRVTPSMGGMDGEESSQCIIDVYQLTEGAPVKAKEYGWLPAAGEMSLVKDNLEAVNAMLEAVGGTKIVDGKYWLSQRRNANYPWFFDAAENGFGSWMGGMTRLLVRPCMGAEEYEAEE